MVWFRARQVLAVEYNRQLADAAQLNLAQNGVTNARVLRASSDVRALVCAAGMENGRARGTGSLLPTRARLQAVCTELAQDCTATPKVAPRRQPQQPQPQPQQQGLSAADLHGLDVMLVDPPRAGCGARMPEMTHAYACMHTPSPACAARTCSWLTPTLARCRLSLLRIECASRLDGPTLALLARFRDVLYISCNPLAAHENVQALRATHVIRCAATRPPCERCWTDRVQHVGLARVPMAGKCACSTCSLVQATSRWGCTSKCALATRHDGHRSSNPRALGHCHCEKVRVLRRIFFSSTGV